MTHRIQAQFEHLQGKYGNLYDFLNHFRAWVNDNTVNYEVFLEDNWFDAHTTIEYTFRCLETFNILVFAEDEYKNSRDEKGVWHLGEYQKTRWTLENPWEAIAAFIAENTPPRFKQDGES